MNINKLIFITKENLAALVENLKKMCDEFIAPQRGHLGDIIFGDTKYSGGELLEYEGNSVISPRAFLLPQTEVLFEIKSAKEGKFIPLKDEKRRIFYGVRPCDIKALKLMRRFFLDGVVDKQYKEKLDNALFISLACNKKCSSGAFCCEMDAGPVASDGFDLQLIRVSRGYLAEVGSRKAETIVKKNKKLFAKPLGSDVKETGAIFKNFTEGKNCGRPDYKRIAGLIRQNKVKEAVWEDIGLRCVVCSGCITLCPTCSCFSIRDILDGDHGVRVRYCDGCPFAGFTRMAGGAAPFPMHKDHIRRFFEHKLSVDVERYGTPSCVGCARCIQTCPGNISIKKFIEDLDAKRISA